MSEFTFSCPICAGAVAIDDTYAGYEIQCPLCQGAIIVPHPAEAEEGYEGEYDEEEEGAECPSCGAEMEEEAIICMECGYNTQTGKKLGADKPKKKKKKKAKGEGGLQPLLDPMIQAGILSVIFVGLGIGSFFSDGAWFAYAGLYVLFSFAVWVFTVIEGFREEPLAGILNLICCWPYTLYFVYGRSDNDGLKVNYSLQIIVGLVFRFVLPEAEVDGGGFEGFEGMEDMDEFEE